MYYIRLYLLSGHHKKQAMHRKFSIKQVFFMVIIWWLIIYFYVYIGFLGLYELFESSPMLDYFDSGYYHLEVFLQALVFGILFYLINFFTENSAVRRHSFIMIILIKSVLYIVSLTLVGFFINILFKILGFVEQDQIEYMLKSVSPNLIFPLVLYFLVAIIILNGLIEVSRKLGPEEWINLLIGRYHEPKTEELIFCFMIKF